MVHGRPIAERRDGIADTNAPGFGFLSGAGSDIDEHFVDVQNAGALGFGQKMGWFGGHHADDFCAVIRFKLNALGEKTVTPPAAEGDDFQKTIGLDRLHAKTDFVHVTSDEDFGRFVALGGFLLAKKRADAVVTERAVIAKFGGENGANLVLVARNGVSLSEFFEESQRFAFHEACLAVMRPQDKRGHG